MHLFDSNYTTNTMDSGLIYGYNYFMDTITVKAWAKINLTLDVLGKRPTGYHELSSVMQTIGLYDLLTIEQTQNPGITLKAPEGKDLPPDFPIGKDNLIYQAAATLLERYDVLQGVAIELTKNIPIAAGLAGGSSNAAATLTGINELFKLKIPRERLMEIGRELGSDIPFCIFCLFDQQGGTALVEGTGEKITALPNHPEAGIVLVRPKEHVSTKEIFSMWTGMSERQTPYMLDAIKKGDIRKISENLSNDLTQIATGLHPQILDILNALRKQKALGVNMTGSGPTVFGYFPSEYTALLAMERVGQEFPDCEVFCTKPKSAKG